MSSLESLRTVEAIARAAGAELMRHFDGLDADAIQSKSAARDLVTAADLASERVVMDGLREAFPGDGFLAEESGEQNAGAEHVCIGRDATINGNGGIGCKDGIGLDGDADVPVIVRVSELTAIDQTISAKNVVFPVGGGSFNGGEDIGFHCNFGGVIQLCINAYGCIGEGACNG